MPVCRSCGKKSYDCRGNISAACKAYLNACRHANTTAKREEAAMKTLGRGVMAECLYECALTDPRFIEVLIFILRHYAKMGDVDKVKALLARLSFTLTHDFLDNIVLHSCRAEYYSDLPRLAAIIGLFRKAGYTVSADTMGCLEARINWLIKQAGADLTKAKRYLVEAETNLAKAEAEADLAEAKADLAEAERHFAFSESSLSSLMAEKELIMTA